MTLLSVVFDIERTDRGTMVTFPRLWQTSTSWCALPLRSGESWQRRTTLYLVVVEGMTAKMRLASVSHLYLREHRDPRDRYFPKQADKYDPCFFEDDQQHDIVPGIKVQVRYRS